MLTYLQSPRALSNGEITEVYALADRHNVGICLYGGTQSPSQGPAEWSASGSILALRRFAREAGMRVIPKPKYPEVRWTDKNRWE
jgi:hypothetical protein